MKENGRILFPGPWKGVSNLDAKRYLNFSLWKVTSIVVVVFFLSMTERASPWRINASSPVMLKEDLRIVSGSVDHGSMHDQLFSDAETSPSTYPAAAPEFNWVLLPSNQDNGSCMSNTNCCADILCYGLAYTPGVSGQITSYTSGFFINCPNVATAITYNQSCVLFDWSFESNTCMTNDSILFNSSGQGDSINVTSGVTVILHQVCFDLSSGGTIMVTEDEITDLTVSLDLTGGGHVTEFPDYSPFLINMPVPLWPANGTSTVACFSEAIEPVVPTATDICGNVIIADSISMVDQLVSVSSCNGSRTYTYSFDDCSGNTHLWTYIYTIEQVALPMEMGDPVDADSTISCGLEGLPPTDLPVFVDDCGTVIIPLIPVVGGTYTGGCDGTITYTYTYVSCGGLEYEWTYTYTVVCFPLSLRVFLEGPYHAAGDSMRPWLNYLHVLPGQDKENSPFPSVQDFAPYTPFGHPYNVFPWSLDPASNAGDGMGYGEPTSPGAPMGVLPYPADVVDWILVTVRQDGLFPVDNIWTCAGWVHTDGEVTFPEDCGALTIDPMEDYHILVQHRNHLGVMSPPGMEDRPCGGIKLEWDFTTANSYEPEFRFGQKQVETGTWAMHAANGDQVLFMVSINSEDRTTWRILQNSLGYFIGDYNMDVITDSEDETLWKVNQNRTSGITFY